MSKSLEELFESAKSEATKMNGELINVGFKYCDSSKRIEIHILVKNKNGMNVNFITEVKTSHNYEKLKMQVIETYPEFHILHD